MTTTAQGGQLDHPQEGMVRLVRGTVWMLVTWIVTTVSGPVLAIALVREMSHEQYGRLSVATSAIALLSVVAGIGLAGAVSQVASSAFETFGEAGMSSTLKSSLRLSIRASGVATLLTLGVIVAFSGVSRLHADAPPMLAMLPSVTVAPFAGTFIGLLRATYRPRWLTLATTLSSLVAGLLVVVALVAGHPSAVLIAVTRTIGTLLAVLLLGLAVWKWSRSRPPVAKSTDTYRRLRAYGFAMLLTGVFTTSISELDIVILGASRGAHAAAFYTPASALADAVMGLPALVGAFYLPTMSRITARGDMAGVRTVYHWASRWNLVLCAPALTAIIAAPAAALRFLFGPDLVSMATPLRILGVGALVQIIFGFNGLTLDAFGLPRVVLFRQVICIAVDGLACALLVPSLGALGAAIATSISIVLANLLCSASLWSRFRIAPWNRSSFLTSVAAVACSGVAVIAIRSASGDLAQVLISATIGAVMAGSVAVAVANVAERRQMLSRARTLVGRVRPVS